MMHTVQSRAHRAPEKTGNSGERRRRTKQPHIQDAVYGEPQTVPMTGNKGQRIIIIDREERSRRKTGEVLKWEDIKAMMSRYQERENDIASPMRNYVFRDMRQTENS